jgi:hypothetical protein
MGLAPGSKSSRNAKTEENKESREKSVLVMGPAAAGGAGLR